MWADIPPLSLSLTYSPKFSAFVYYLHQGATVNLWETSATSVRGGISVWDSKSLHTDLKMFA